MMRKFRDLLGQEMLILNNQQWSQGDEGIELSHDRHMETTSRRFSKEQRRQIGFNC